MDLRAPVLLCKKCGKNKAPESVVARLLIGDVFVLYTCPTCSPTGSQTLERLPMNWVNIVHLVLYHLHSTSGQNKIFFRWKEDICRVIEERWDDICPTRSASGSWMNSIGSILSANSHLFESGLNAMKQSGWWALKDPSEGPKVMTMGEGAGQQILGGKRRKAPTVLLSEGEDNVPASDEPVDVVEDSPRRKRESPRKVKEPPSPRKLSPTRPQASGQPAANLSGSSSPQKTSMQPLRPVPVPIRPNGAAGPIQPIVPPSAPSASAIENHLRALAAARSEIPAATSDPNLVAAEEIKRKLVERLLRVDSELLKQALTRDPTKAGQAGLPAAKKELPKKKAKPAHYIRASPHENELVELTNRVLNPDDQINRLKRKLAVRKIKRMNGTQLFDLDNWIYQYLKSNMEPLALLPASAEHLLEGLRTRLTSNPPGVDDSLIRGGAEDELVAAELSDVPFLKDPSLSFRAKLMGVMNLDGYPFPVVSPYSGKPLPVLIHRETTRLPVRLKLLHDLRSEQCNSDDEFIDFVHLRKEFMPQLNRLLQAHFWPGIDVSESLDWPDFTIVLLYRKLIIGTAICNPEGYISYLLVHPDWQGAGLASKMLFFMATKLVPPGKDMSVHVAVGNGPAMCLYQRFGFKPEEFIVDFYSKRYSRAGGDENALPDPSLRNAFYLRLRR